MSLLDVSRLVKLGVAGWGDFWRAYDASEGPKEITSNPPAPFDFCIHFVGGCDKRRHKLVP